MAKCGSRETRKEAVVEIQVKEDGSWNQSGRSVMVHLGTPCKNEAFTASRPCVSPNISKSRDRMGRQPEERGTVGCVGGPLNFRPPGALPP